MAENEIQIKVNQIGKLTISEEQHLSEVKDVDYLSRISEALPQLALTGINTGAVSSSKDLYKVIIPAGEQLRKSRDMEGAFRAVYGANRFEGHANLVKTNPIKANGVAALNIAVCAAALISGQYYMDQINKQLAKINESIDKISNFQRQEFESKILNICDYVRRYSEFKEEIIVNDEQRKEVLRKLVDYESDTCQLIYQTNLALANAVHKRSNKYESYEKDISEIESWYGYQQILLNILYEIENLRYTLDFGGMSTEFYYAAYNSLFAKSHGVQYRILMWHINNMNKFRIDPINKNRQPQRNWIARKIRHTFKSVPDQTINMINSQGGSYFINQNPRKPLDVFDNCIQLVNKDGKLYYLPRANDENGEES